MLLTAINNVGSTTLFNPVKLQVHDFFAVYNTVPNHSKTFCNVIGKLTFCNVIGNRFEECCAAHIVKNIVQHCYTPI